jgi:zinc protease
LNFNTGCLALAMFCAAAAAAEPAATTQSPTAAGTAHRSAAAHPPAAPARPPPAIPIPEIAYTKFVLGNGLVLLVHEDHKSPVVAINTWYHVGSKNEKPGKTGFAHLFEHLMFSGSANFDHTYINALERIGATDLNGTTNVDRTNYFENVPVSMLDLVLFAESDRMGHLLGVLDQKKLDLQRGVVQNEKRQGENQPYGVTRQLLTENLYPAGHPYSWTTIGSMDDLNAASLQDVQDWFKTNYGPNNTVLVLAGDITPEVARDKVEKYYGEIPAGPPLARQSVWIAKRTGTRRGSVEDRVPQARAYRLWNIPEAYSAEEPLLDLAAQVLGGGKTSRFYQRLVYRDQLATSASASVTSGEIGGHFDLVLTAVPGGDLAKLERGADEELARLIATGPTAAELAIAKTNLIGDFVRGTERVGGFGGKSDVLARCATFTGDPHCYAKYYERIAAATPASVARVMKDWLSDGDYVLEVHPYPGDFATTAPLDRSHEPTPGTAPRLDLPAMQRTRLSNGLELFLAERHGVGVVTLSLLVDAGYAADAPALPGASSFALRMLEEGTAGRDSIAVSTALESLNAKFGTSSSLDGSTVNLTLLRPTLKAGLAIYADLVQNPAFAEKDFERLRKERLAAIRREKVTPQATALRVLPTLLYGKGHAYASPFSGLGTEESLGRIARADLVAFHRTWFKPNNAKLLIVGDTTLAEITPELERLFRDWRPGEVPGKTIAPVAARTATTVYLIDRPGAQQSVIAGAALVPPGSDPDALTLDLVNDILGGTFSSRANMNLREDKHWSYGVRSLLIDAIGQRPLISIAPVQSDKTADALREMSAEYRGVAGGRPITARELADAAANETLGLPGAFETAKELGDRYLHVLQYHLPDDYYQTLAARTLAVSAEQANAIAHRLVKPDETLWVVVGDMAKVEAGIRDLHLGEVRRIDADGNAVK